MPKSLKPWKMTITQRNYNHLCQWKQSETHHKQKSIHLQKHINPMNTQKKTKKQMLLPLPLKKTSALIFLWLVLNRKVMSVPSRTTYKTLTDLVERLTTSSPYMWTSLRAPWVPLRTDKRTRNAFSFLIATCSAFTLHPSSIYCSCSLLSFYTNSDFVSPGLLSVYTECLQVCACLCRPVQACAYNVPRSE